MDIEEVAFKDRKNLVQLNENDLLDIIEFLQLDRKQWINQFSKAHNESIDVQEENQELKLELSGYRQAILNNKEMLGLKEQNQALKKQLDYLRSEEYYNQLRYERDMLQNVVDNGEVPKEDKQFIDMTHRNTELLEQQKEFIKYLEDEIQKEREKSITLTAFIRNVVPLQHCLQKYKEITQTE